MDIFLIIQYLLNVRSLAIQLMLSMLVFERKYVWSSNLFIITVSHYQLYLLVLLNSVYLTVYSFHQQFSLHILHYQFYCNIIIKEKNISVGRTITYQLKFKCFYIQVLSSISLQIICCEAYQKFKSIVGRAVRYGHFSIEDFVHVEPSDDPSVSGRASSQNLYPRNCSSIWHMLQEPIQVFRKEFHHRIFIRGAVYQYCMLQEPSIDPSVRGRASS